MFGPLPIVPWDFELPERVVTQDFVLRPLSLDLFHLDFEAYNASREHLQQTFNLDGVPFGPAENRDAGAERWPAGTDVEFGLIGAAWCHYEWKYLRSSFTYSILDAEERRELGNAYVYPCHKADYDICCQSWVRTDLLASGFDDSFHDWFRHWVDDVWPFEELRVGWPGRTVTWEDWNALPNTRAYDDYLEQVRRFAERRRSSTA
jgi:hypothetical protein